VTEQERIDALITYTGGTLDSDTATAYLSRAAQVIFEVRFPYDDYPDDVEARYQMLQVEIAEELYDKMGAEGQTSHSENGISREWENSQVSNALIARITPKVGVL
jgi:hypothetical protein